MTMSSARRTAIRSMSGANGAAAGGGTNAPDAGFMYVPATQDAQYANPATATITVAMSVAMDAFM
jgi:hypothetical protein